MKLIDGYFVDCKDRNVITVLHTSKSLKLSAGNYTVVIDNVLDKAFTIKLPKPAEAVGCFYSIIMMANPSNVATPADVTVLDGDATSCATLDTWGESVVLWSDGFYFHDIST